PGTATPTGTVQFINTSAAPSPNVIGTAPVVVGPAPGGAVGNVYTASITIATLPPGTPTIIARYSGDTGYLGSDSAILNQGINKAPTNMTLTSSLSSSTLGNQVTSAIAVV